MNRRYYPKRINPKTMITHFSEIFKTDVLKKTTLRNLLLATIAVAVVKTFRISEIASRLPILVKTEKSKHKRFLRFLDVPFPIEAVKKVWFAFLIGHLWRQPYQYRFLLIDETDLIDGWKAIVAAVPFRNRAIPVFWHIYKDEQIRDLTYKSHNEILQGFCLKLYDLALKTSPKRGQMPVLVFDRGFARAKYVIDFLKQRNIGCVMRICSNVGITYHGSTVKLDGILENGSYPDVLYHKTYQIPLNLYVIRDKAFKEPMYLISNVYKGHQIHHCYKRRMQIEHGFRDIKTRFGFRHLVLKNPRKPASHFYGSLFVSLTDYSLFLTRRRQHIGQNLGMATEKSTLLLQLSRKSLPILGHTLFSSHFLKNADVEAIHSLKLIDLLTPTATQNNYILTTSKNGGK